ncbi:MAG: hypothetical protein ACREJO_10200 [Phycisphaerales bacterium]
MKNFAAKVGVAVLAAAAAWGVLALLMASRAAQGAVMVSPAARFQWVDVYVTTDGWSLGAWQAEVAVAAGGGTAKLAGVEGGEGAFTEAPEYDAAALSGGRIILGGMTTAAGAPGRVRVARLHVMVEGDAAARFEATLTAAGDSTGSRRTAEVSLVPGSIGTDESK